MYAGWFARNEILRVAQNDKRTGVVFYYIYLQDAPLSTLPSMYCWWWMGIGAKDEERGFELVGSCGLVREERDSSRRSE